jgi:error-prone DNA polymerase
MAYIELQCTTNFSFLQGASHPHEVVEHAASLGYTAIGIADTNTLAGIVRAHVAAKKCNIKLVVGAHLTPQDGAPVLAYPINKNGYAQLCELLTIGNLRTQKGNCLFYKTDMYQQLTDVVIIACAPLQLNHNYEVDAAFIADLQAYKNHFGNLLYLAICKRYNGTDAKLIAALETLANTLQLPTVVTNNVYYHCQSRKHLQDVLTCIKQKCTIANAGYKLYVNAERYLKPIPEMQRLFVQQKHALQNTIAIANLCTFSLDELCYEYPEEVVHPDKTPQQHLTELAWQGAAQIYGATLPQVIINNINHELAFIAQMEYAPYFLTVYDIVKFARSKNILCQGRGSAANSTICFVLGITSVNPAKFDLLFERFLSAARNEPPDIDVDFEHERREEVIQYIYQKYGRHRAAIVATVTQQQEKGAVRDVAKAMGLSLDVIEKIAKSIMRSSSQAIDINKLTELGININDALIQKTVALINQYIGFPRQLGQHTGGFVISRHKLTQLCPVINARMQNRTCLEWNKDDIEALGFLKIDILALGMLTCIQKAFALCALHYNKHYTLANIPQDDAAVYNMISNADTIGVFQIESRAQQSMLPRLRPNCFYDLVIEVAIVRPGPIQGDMVHPYLRRRTGQEKVQYPSKELENILKKTLGVPLFQEQAMRVAIVAAGFTPTEADELRKSMATFKVKGKVSQLHHKLINGMVAKGYTPDYAERVFKQLEGFGSYGFPESHAASFALLVYVSAWLKCFYPDVFACALLNSLPMGFYQPAQIVTDAKQHGVTILPVDVNYSHWDNTLEPAENSAYKALRLGFRNVKNLQRQHVTTLLAARTQPFTSMFCLSKLGLSSSCLQILSAADAFTSLQQNRRNALWHAIVQDTPIGLFKNQPDVSPQLTLPLMAPVQEVMHDYASLALSLKAHPMQFLRPQLQQLKAITNAQLAQAKNGDTVKIAGLVLMRQRPGTAKGIWFVTLEDETTTANLVLFTNISARYKKELVHAKIMLVQGTVQIEGQVIHVLAKQIFNITGWLHTQLQQAQQQWPAPSRADEVTHPVPQKNLPQIHAGRNFK